MDIQQSVDVLKEYSFLVLLLTSIGLRIRKIIANELKKSRKAYKKNNYYTRKSIDSYKSKPSHHILNVKKIYNLNKLVINTNLSKKTGCSINSLRKIYNKMNIDFSHLEMSLRNISYIQYEVLPKFHNGFNDNQDLRIRYLQNLITEEQFKQTLLSRKRRSDKNKEISVILHTFLTSIIDLFHRFKHDLREFLSNVDNRNFIRLQKFHDDFYFEIDNLIMYINSCFQNVTEKYNSKTKYSIASIVFTFYSVSLD
jgi:hypothetical protein